MVTAECHAHIFMDGVDYKKAAAAHENGPREDLIREHLAAYQKAGISYVRDGGDPYGAGVLARSLAPEYGITYRTPVFAPLYCFVPVILSYPDSPPISPTLHLPSLQWNPSACLSFAHLKFPLQPDKL